MCYLCDIKKLNDENVARARRAERLDYERALARVYEARRYGCSIAHIIMFEIDIGLLSRRRRQAIR